MNDVFAKNQATSAADAAKIIPRAEFRVFGQGVIDIVKQLMWNGKTVLFQARRMPAETYFLSVKTDEANVKVRDGLLDIKTKVGETPEGYEIFQPRGKFQFPVKRDDLATILSHLKVSMTLEQASYTIDEFVAMARKHPELCPVSVEKMRYGFTIDGIICEYAQVWLNGAMVETACAESENYAAMKQVVEGLGISAMPNTNYLKAAKRVVGMV
ncbi:MAG: hypothetical protein KAX57_06145 [Rhodoferax sp.]|uniref:hypothetical protein n=1 Tax=Rhodoferax sp. TaxID=50421 RepID=UPI001B698214|nr:hypothetical protein [Rhodoferax sp.]MBP8286404.1 hypothetical protein [Rhodoferax sp.]MBP9150141.1 hypothetical protein [Rhodoferax sp.]MBP9737390.1 hypothetical protein [Rhodoferax sp.]